jgi:dephospho-CoA kinase
MWEFGYKKLFYITVLTVYLTFDTASFSLNSIITMPKKLKIAVTGGIGSGKSSVCDIFHSDGYPILYADDISKEILSTDQSVKEKIVKEFGSESFFEGKPNHKFLSEKVFSDEKKVGKINSILHPPVIEKIVSLMEHELKQSKMVFVEAALIYEAKMEHLFDYVIAVTAPDETRIKRVMESRGLSKDEVINRMNKQIPQEKKKSLADFVIENNKTKNELMNRAKFVLMILKSMSS